MPAVGDAGTTDYVNVAVGSQPDRRRARGRGHDLADYDSSIECSGDSSATASNSGPLSVGTLAAGDVVDCTITNKRKPRLEVVKKLDPSSDNGTFDLQIDGMTKKVDATHDGTTGFVTVETGAHIVGEVNGTNSPNSLGDYDSEISCDNDDTNTPAGGTSLTTSALDYGDKVTCTITNHRKARIEVVKKLDPSTDNGTFDLQVDDVTEEENAGRQRNDGLRHGRERFAFDRRGQRHELAELAERLRHGDQLRQRQGRATPARRATSSSVGYGDKVICTITNHRKAQIKVVKKLDPATDDGTFNLQVDGVTEEEDAGHNGTTGFVTVANGSHSIGEVNGTNSPNSLGDYDTDIACDSSKGGNTGQTSYGFAVGYGDKVTCTITNHRKAQIKVVKKLDPATDNGTFNLQIDGTTKKENATHNEGTGFVSVANGTHSVGEVNGTSSPNTLGEYDTDIACDSSKGGNTGQTSHSFAVGYGDKVTCEITNHRKARISGMKFHDQNSDRSKAGEPGLSGWEIRAYKDANGNSKADTGELTATTTTGAGGAYTLPLKPGTYVICEVGQPNWAQTTPNPVTNTQCGNVSTAPGGYVLTVAYGSVEADKDFGNAGFGSGSTMTDSAFKLVDDLAPWTIGDFEILINSQNTIVATNPGQFYYHQRATNTSGATNSMQFTINWPCQFMTQTAGAGQPIHAYVQLPSDGPNTWRDWTPQSSNITWTNTNTSPACIKTIVGGTARHRDDHAEERSGRGEGLGDGPSGLQPQGPAAARATTSATSPILYKPFQSTATTAGGSSYLEHVAPRPREEGHRRLRPDDEQGGRHSDGRRLDEADAGLEHRAGRSPRSTAATSSTTGKDAGDGLEGCSASTYELDVRQRHTSRRRWPRTATAATRRGQLPTYPASKTGVTVTSAGTTFATLDQAPSYTFSVAKNSAYSRNWKFRP